MIGHSNDMLIFCY